MDDPPWSDVARIGALADPMRCELYRFVCSQPAPVSHDQAAAAVGIAWHQAKFRIDGLLTSHLLSAIHRSTSALW